jgi:hypothetical protein
MNLRPLAFVAMAVLFIHSARATPPPPVAVVEIDYLLQHIEASGCDFYRNGSWYDGAHAKAHLRMKYDYLVARNQIGSAEDFIDKAASKSSFSGQPYKIRCEGASAVESNPWLRDALEHSSACLVGVPGDASVCMANSNSASTGA